MLFLQLGKLPGRVRPGSTTAFRHVLEEFRTEGWSLVGDLAGGTRQPFFGWSDFAEVIAVVVEPSAKGLLSARRLAALAGTLEGATVGMVASKVRGAADLRLIAEGVDLPVLGAVPYDEQLAAADRLGRPPIEAAPDSAAVAAIVGLAAALEDRVRTNGKDER